MRPAPCPVYVLPLTRTYDLKAMRAAFELRRFLKQQRVALVQTFFESSDLWAGFVVRAMSKAKLVWSRRDMGILRSRKHTVAYRWMRGAPHAVLAVSEQVRRHLLEVDGVDPSRVTVVYNGLDLGYWEGSPSREDVKIERVVTTVGNIRRVKGHDLYIRAAGAIAREFPGVRFSIAGAVLEEEYFRELQSLVREMGLSERFHFAGGLSDLREHLREADIFVLPSRSEGFSNAIVEAMAASLPVIATDVGGNAEAVEDGVSGVIVPPESVEALAGAMRRLLADPAMTRAMGGAGRRRAVERFTTGAMLEQITAVYGKLLGTAPR